MTPSADPWILIEIEHQQLSLLHGEQQIAQWPVSTAMNGPGERMDSGCTPRGEHRVRIKVGDGCQPNTVFVGRRPTGETFSEQLAAEYPDRDWILTRIIWLTGTESGHNRGAGRDTLRRYIYIHGAPDSASMGAPGSHGCIRMRNVDLITLYDQIERGTRVLITGPAGSDAQSA